MTHPILGPARCTSAQAAAYAKSRRAEDWFADLAVLYWRLAPRHNVRPEVAWAQAGHETGWGHFGRAVTRGHNNYCGLKVRNPGADDAAESHARFNTPTEGVIAHIEHLGLYAGAPGTPVTNPIDPRHFPQIHGTAVTVEQLSTRWAPSTTYHERILEHLEGMMPDSPGVTIVSRAQWAARPPKSRHIIDLPTPELWLHHFATDGWHGEEGMRRCQDFHMDSRGWSDIAYSFCVDTNGRIFEGRGAGVAGGHTKGRNSVSHAICAMINSEATRPTAAMIQSIAALAAHGVDRGWWEGWTGGHRNAPGASTACPGKHLVAAWNDITALTEQYLGQSPATEDHLMYHLELEATVKARLGPNLSKAVWVKLAHWENVLTDKVANGDNPRGALDWILANEAAFQG